MSPGFVKNKIKEVRIKAGLSQKALAGKIGTSQQQIQRWENGQTVRIDFASKIAEACRVDVRDIFPELKATEKHLKRTKSQEKRESVLSEAGLTGSAIHKRRYFKFRLDGFKQSRCFEVAEDEYQRLWRLSAEDPAEKEVESCWVFHTLDGWIVALQPRELLYAQFLWDAGSVEGPNVESSKSSSTEGKAQGSADPEVEDEADDDDGREFRIDLVRRQKRFRFLDPDFEEIRDFFDELEELGYGGASRFFAVTDEDGEPFLIPIAKVGFAMAPLDWVAPAEEFEDA